MHTFQGLLSSWSTLRFCLWSIWLVFYSVYSWLIWSHQRQLILGFWEFRIWLATGVFPRDIHIILRILCCQTICYTNSAKQYRLVILILMYSECACFCFTWRSNWCGKWMEMPQQNFTELASWFAGHPPNHQTCAKEVHIFTTACLFKINICRSWCLTYSYSLQKPLIYPTKDQRSENLWLFTGWQLLAFIFHEIFTPFFSKIRHQWSNYRKTHPCGPFQSARESGWWHYPYGCIKEIEKRLLESKITSTGWTTCHIIIILLLSS